MGSSSWAVPKNTDRLISTDLGRGMRGGGKREGAVKERVGKERGW